MHFQFCTGVMFFSSEHLSKRGFKLFQLNTLRKISSFNTGSGGTKGGQGVAAAPPYTGQGRKMKVDEKRK